LVYEVHAGETAQSIVDALTEAGYRAHPGSSPESGKLRIHVAVTGAEAAGEGVDGIVARHDPEAVALT